MDSIRLAVISDIHVGNDARSRDLCPGDNSHLVEEKYLATFGNFVKSENISVDYLILPGDLSSKAKEDEFKHGSIVLDKLLDIFKLDKSKVIFVPGNHDVDWEVMGLDHGSDLRKQQRYDPLKKCTPRIQDILGCASGSMLEEPCYATWTDQRIYCVGINSAFYDGPNINNHPGLIMTESLNELDDHLTNSEIDEDVLRLLVVHHHPQDYANPIPNDPDFSMMRNASELLGVLGKHRFDLLIHGHKHAPCVQPVLTKYNHRIEILCAGSFSVQLPSRWSGKVNNQFHEIMIQGRESDSGNIMGQILSWTFIAGDGWVKSQIHNGIRHVERFGSIVQPKIFEKTLIPYFEKARDNNQHFRWSMIREKEKLQYVSPVMLEHVVNKLAERFGFDPVDQVDDIILLPKEAD